MMDVISTPAAGPDKKADTRRRILDAATALFRAHGIDGVGVDAVMRAAGLTHGGFYGHFASKETLAAEVCGASLDRSAAKWEAIVAEAPAAEARRRIVTNYLRPESVTQGCLLPALGPDIARRPEARAQASAALFRMAAALEIARPPEAPGGLAALATLVGALVLARVAEDPAQAAAILAAAHEAVLPEG
jgi:TetR/AcrR family transcriptional repressor of nem operon